MSLNFYAPSPFPSPPAYWQAGGEEGGEGKFQISFDSF